jgi:hypothetical protein
MILRTALDRYDPISFAPLEAYVVCSGLSAISFIQLTCQSTSSAEALGELGQVENFPSRQYDRCVLLLTWRTTGCYQEAFYPYPWQGTIHVCLACTMHDWLHVS